MLFGMTASMVIEQRKGVAVDFCIKAWLTDVGHQSFFSACFVPLHLLLCTCAPERQICVHLYSKGGASGFHVSEAVNLYAGAGT